MMQAPELRRLSELLSRPDVLEAAVGTACPKCRSLQATIRAKPGSRYAVLACEKCGYRRRVPLKGLYEGPSPGPKPSLNRPGPVDLD